MKKIFIPILSAAVLFAACTKNEMNPPQTVEYEAPEYISASSQPLSKVHVDGYSVSWTEGDCISLFPKSDALVKYELEEISAENPASATFKYSTECKSGTNLLEKNVAVFPHRESDNAISGNAVTTRIKKSQDYKPAAFLCNAPMVAVSDGNSYEFRNVASVLRFNVTKDEEFTDECVLNSIGITSASKYLSGLVSIDTAADEWVAEPSSEQNAEVSLSGLDATLSTTDAVSFCIVVPSATYPANDLTITLTYNESSTKTAVYPLALTVGAGKIQDINLKVKASEEGTITAKSVVTGDPFQYNGHEHVTCYTASLCGSVNATGEVSEFGVIYQRTALNDVTAAALVKDNVGKIGGSTKDEAAAVNLIKSVAAPATSGETVIKITDLAGGSATDSYIYRFYAVIDGAETYGDIKTFKTDTYDTFVPVAAGSFTMGANSDDNGYDAEFKTAPAHTVVLTKDFEISRYEVTQEQFVKFLNKSTEDTGVEASSSKTTDVTITTNTLTAKTSSTRWYVGTTTDINTTEEISLTYTGGTWATPSRKKFPMERVTYAGATAYCEWLTSYLNDGYTYRLPTEAEWEYAARGGNQSKGYKFSGSNSGNEVSQYKDNSKGGWYSINRIGELYPNELGIYDMSGNLWELVKDQSDYNWTPTNAADLAEPKGYFAWCAASVSNPTGPTASNGKFTKNDSESNIFYCVRKGGSANDTSGNTAFCPGYRRNDGQNKTFSHVTMGFRVVRVK